MLQITNQYCNCSLESSICSINCQFCLIGVKAHCLKRLHIIFFYIQRDASKYQLFIVHKLLHVTFTSLTRVKRQTFIRSDVIFLRTHKVKGLFKITLFSSNKISNNYCTRTAYSCLAMNENCFLGFLRFFLFRLPKY